MQHNSVTYLLKLEQCDVIFLIYMSEPIFLLITLGH